MDDPRPVSDADLMDFKNEAEGAISHNIDIHYRPLVVLDLIARIEQQQAEIERLRDEKDGAYQERNRVVSALSKVFPSGLKSTDIPGWNPEWHGCVYIDLPTGQVSWHFHESQRSFFDHLPVYDGEWDGHETDEKYRRLEALTSPPAEHADSNERE